MNDINGKTATDVRQIVLDIIAEIAPDADLSNLKGGVSEADQTPLRDLLGLDSMDFLDIVMELRKDFWRSIACLHLLSGCDLLV